MKTIYIDGESKPKTLGDKISIYAGEIATIDRLMTMGFNFYGRNFSLGKRAEELTRRIANLEALFKANPKAVNYPA